MSTWSIVSRVLPVVAHRSGIARALSHRYRGVGTIFMLHSVVADGDYRPDQSLRCSVSSLNRLLSTLRAEGIEFLSLDEALNRLDRPRGKPFAVFTFDDGFADNYRLALPVMERHNAPFTVYVATGMMHGQIDAWWLGLAELIRRSDSINIKSLDYHVSCADRASKAAAYVAIEALIHHRYDVLPAVRQAITDAGIDCAALAHAEGLSAGELARLASNPLVTIGAHGETHINLALASDGEVRGELQRNRAFLQDIIGRPVQHLAYPFGNELACGEREAKIARELGFRSAVTTRNGMLFPQHRGSLLELPRERLVEADTASTLHCKINGFYRAAHSRFGAPVARMASNPAIAGALVLPI